MRGPEGPVRGGVTRCGRPPPRLRGRGKWSRLSSTTLSKLCLPRSTIVPPCRPLSSALSSAAFGLRPLEDPRTTGKVAGTRGRRRCRGIFTTKAKTKRKRARVVESGGETGDASGGKGRCRVGGRVRKSVGRRWSCCSACCADSGAAVGRRPSPVARSTARGR